TISNASGTSSQLRTKPAGGPGVATSTLPGFGGQYVSQRPALATWARLTVTPPGRWCTPVTRPPPGRQAIGAPSSGQGGGASLRSAAAGGGIVSQPAPAFLGALTWTGAGPYFTTAPWPAGAIEKVITDWLPKGMAAQVTIPGVAAASARPQ